MQVEPTINDVKTHLQKRIDQLKAVRAEGKKLFGTPQQIPDNTWERWRGELAGYGIAMDILEGKL